LRTLRAYKLLITTLLLVVLLAVVVEGTIIDLFVRAWNEIRIGPVV
jgi:hypothetical protein